MKASASERNHGGTSIRFDAEKSLRGTDPWRRVES
jgi:hypothetical protein